ncbi:MAG TPA: prenyltransferase/squalene oxidase repeat-containing protein [Planctomycetota bacterium]|nr:prenyltransferase/squalene oxidase repeat-containing protein [Planctomycetota bacterium]
MITTVLALGLLLQDPPKVNQRAIDYAVERGGLFLVGELARPIEGKFAEKMRWGRDELILYALIHVGVDYSNHRAYTTALEEIATQELRNTYQASLTALVLESVDKVKYYGQLAQCAQFLVDNQCANGQWSYGKPVKMPDLPKGPAKDGGTVTAIKIVKRGKGPDRGDNSNSQYAALGLRACAAAGLQLPDEVFTAAAKWWEKNQGKDGGWGYADAGQMGDPSYGSMTAGGVASLIIFRHLLRQDTEKHAPIKKAMEWMGSNLVITENPGYERPYQWHHYWLYAVERAGILGGTEKLGDHWWYSEGVDHLLKAQDQKRGFWISEKNGMESVGGAAADTAFAILFLRRATKPLVKVITGK